jgi:IclR family mhp operon transcriptional activator
MGESSKSILHNLLMDVGGEALGELCREISWPSDLAVYDRGEMHILDTSRSKTPFVINMTGVGYRVPMLQTGLGRAWLAFCPAAEREAILADLAKSKRPFDRLVHEPGYVRAVIEETRAKGYGLRAAGFTLRAKGEEKTDGIGVPVLMGGRVIACISFVWTLPALNEQKVVKLYLKRMFEVAARIGKEVERRMSARGLQRPDSSR